MTTLKQVPLTCGGHTRPVVHLDFSDVTKDGYFLISACKGKFYFITDHWSALSPWPTCRWKSRKCIPALFFGFHGTDVRCRKKYSKGLHLSYFSKTLGSVSVTIEALLTFSLRTCRECLEVPPAFPRTCLPWWTVPIRLCLFLCTSTECLLKC